MHPGMLLLAERLVVAVEGMSQDVKNISTYVNDLSQSVSRILNEKESDSLIPYDEDDNPPLDTPTAREEVPVESEHLWQYEEVNVSSVPQRDDLEQEEIFVGEVPTFSEGMKTEEQSESEENHELYGLDNTSDSGRNSVGVIAEVIKEEIDTSGESFPLKEESDVCVPPFTLQNEESSIKMSQPEHGKYSIASSFVHSEASTSHLLPIGAVDTQEHFSQNAYSSECQVLQLRGLHCQPPFAVASCSSADDKMDHAEAVDRNLMEEEGGEQVLGERHRHYTDQSEERMCTYYEPTHPEREMQNPALLSSSTETNMREQKKRTFECYICKLPFSSNSQFITHMRAHSGGRPVKGTTSVDTFQQNPQVQSHMPTHVNERFHRCRQCGKSFRRVSALRLHMQFHITERPFKCSQCGKSFNAKAHLTRHVRAHTGEKPFKCNKCEKSFSESDNLKKHMFTHTGIKPFTCHECGKQFVRRTELKNHMLTHTGERPFICGLCGKAFFQKVALNTHMVFHMDEKSFKCTFCEKSFFMKGGLRRHMRIHTGEKPFKCSVCGKSFTESGSLKSHMPTHTGIKPFRCDLCGRQFNRPGELEKHMLTHTGERPFKCEQCGKAFFQNVQLSKHMLFHKNEKSFECSQCGKAFVIKAHLTRHMRVHTGEKPFKCTECGKSFGESGTLKNHMSVHTGIKPFRCALCGRQFARPNLLASHKCIHIE